MPTEAVQNSDKTSRTIYRLAEKSSDFRAAHSLLSEVGRGREEITFKWPTVLALENDEVVGALGTVPNKSMIQAGPLVLKQDRNRRYTALRLVEIYETLLQTMGISTYTIYVDNTDEKTMALMLRLPATVVISEEEEGILFARRLK